MSVATHLWESTLCAVLAALLVRALRDAPAGVRYCIWFCASLKFLVPLWPLAALGAAAGAWASPAATPAAASAIQWVDQTLPRWTIAAASAWVAPGFLSVVHHAWTPALLAIWAAGAFALVTWRWRQWRALSQLTREALPLECGREASALARVRPASGASSRTTLLLAPAGLAPAVIGLFRPSLLWPAGLSRRLTDRQLEAVLAHELCHVRRRDNLSALIHVIVEVLFWFHPVVWWVGARLVSERERACDEEVLRMGTHERQYAEAILRVCDFSLRAPAAFAASVGGSELTRRIERILSRRQPAALAGRIRVLLGSVLLFILAAPVGVGVLNAGRASGPPAPGDVEPGTPARAEQSGDVPRPGNGISWPKLIYEVKPSYTPHALQAHIQGVAVLEAVVLEDGTVGEVTIVESLDPDYGLDDEAVAALEQWRFEPGMRDGEPVAVLVSVEVSFTLK